ncbi:hypothetical protein D515_03616 [Grimontia indica]|uniref:Uncharacterized protein n=1 Tax=Grimontia indica TaxID=1056512 RepID=R1GNE2_9GAMM|nr:hypothetical protein D515_03616 [Grimontia indica]
MGIGVYVTVGRQFESGDTEVTLRLAELPALLIGLRFIEPVLCR